MKSYGTVYCPNEDCEAPIEVTEFEVYDPGVCSGPPENCYPPEGGECYGGDKCEKCGTPLDDKFWEEAYEALLSDIREREDDARVEEAAISAAEARAERYYYGD